MKQILIIGNENLKDYKKVVAKMEQDKTGYNCFIASSFISDLADETTEYILLDDNKRYAQHVFPYLDDAEEFNKHVRKIPVASLGEAITRCDNVVKEGENCNKDLFQQLQLKMWLVELQILKTKLGE